MSREISPPPSAAFPPLWSLADRGETRALEDALKKRALDVNARNCLGCTPLLYACGSGHLETVRGRRGRNGLDGGFQVKLLLAQPNIDVNRRNNDRLTSFMLAMQAGEREGFVV